MSMIEALLESGYIEQDSLCSFEKPALQVHSYKPPANVQIRHSDDDVSLSELLKAYFTTRSC